VFPVFYALVLEIYIFCPVIWSDVVHILELISFEMQVLLKHIMHCELQDVTLQNCMSKIFWELAGNYGVYAECPLLM
jgi:hypothetical protein